jgi:hypothetical protein
MAEDARKDFVEGGRSLSRTYLPGLRGAPIRGSSIRENEHPDDTQLHTDLDARSQSEQRHVFDNDVEEAYVKAEQVHMPAYLHCTMSTKLIQLTRVSQEAGY